MKFYWLVLPIALCGMLSLGCGGGDAQNGSGSGGENGEEQVEDAGGLTIKRRDLDSLPAVEAHLPRMDEGRVRIAPPAGWRPVPRDSKYLARFVKGEANELPRIAITAADSPSPEVTNATEENVEELIEPLIAKSKEGKRKPIEPVRPIILGDHVFARHVRIARMNDEPVAIVSLQTVRDGRLYSIELYVKAGSDGSEYAKYLKQSQDSVYAVAANLKFGDEPASAAAPKADPPAEKASEEEKPGDEENP